jgi:hypothetical protein
LLAARAVVDSEAYWGAAAMAADTGVAGREVATEVAEREAAPVEETAVESPEEAPTADQVVEVVMPAEGYVDTRWVAMVVG